MDSKICGRCKQDLPVEEFYFRRDRNAHASRCKKCFAEYQREYKTNSAVFHSKLNSRAEWQRKAAARGRVNLEEVYLKKLLTQKTNLSTASLPAAWIEAKREQIAIQRLAKELKAKLKGLSK